MTHPQPETALISLRGDRPENQDRSLLLEEGESCLLVLGDGLGGHPRGELAAQILVDTCREMWEQAAKPLVNPRYFMQQCILQAHRAIVDFGMQQDPPVSPRTTAVMALLQEGECYWSHAGDSRFYLVRDGGVHVMSRDHVVRNEVATNACLDGCNPGAITRCLGGASQGATPALGTPIPLREGDVVLLCSDGFWGQLEEDYMLSVLHNALPLHNALAILGESACQNGRGQSDNITAVGVRVGRESYGLGGHLFPQDEESELLAAIEHLNQLIEKTL